MKLEVKGSIQNIVSAYAPQVGITAWREKSFLARPGWLIESVSKQERIVLGADLNGHVGEGNIGNAKVIRRYGAGKRNEEGSMVVDFAKRMDLANIG